MQRRLERAKGIEPSYAAWEADLLPTSSMRWLQNGANSALNDPTGYLGTAKPGTHMEADDPQSSCLQRVGGAPVRTKLRTPMLLRLRSNSKLGQALLCHKPYFRQDHFKGGRSVCYP